MKMKSFVRYLVLSISMLFGILSCKSFKNNKNEQNRYQAIYSGVPLFDQFNIEVNAHGACIVKEGDKYYLFGEYKSNKLNVFKGFSCYSSTDLINWKFEKLVLPQQKNGLLGPNRIGERVKVMKCPETGEFVMYMHTDDIKYMDPHIGYATSKTINGEYEFKGALLYDGKPIRKWDMGTFQDTDGKGYLLIHHGIIYELSSNYKSANRIVTSGQEAGESPAMLKSDGIYYWLSSNLTSWERNDNFYLTATSLEGPWTNKGFFTPKGTLTWNSQCSFVLPIQGAKDTTFMYMGDRWAFPRQASSATQVWQPITVSENKISIPEFIQKWKVNTETGEWTKSIINGFIIENNNTKRIKYTGNWIHSELSSDKSISRSDSRGASYFFYFKGVRFKIYGLAQSDGGYAYILIQNSKGVEVLSSIIDMYCLYTETSLKFLSPILPEDNYTVTVSALGDHGNWYKKDGTKFGSTDDFISIDKIIITH